MRHLFLSAAAVLCLQACSPAPAPGPTTTTAPPPPAATASVSPAASTVSPEQLAALKATYKDGHFDYKERTLMANGPVLVAIAESEEKMAGAALEGMAETYTHYAPETKKNHPDAAYKAVVMRYLDSEDPATLFSALRASKNLLGAKPDEEVLSKLTEIADKHTLAPARHEAMESLFALQTMMSNASVSQVFINRLADKDPGVQSLALFRLDNDAFYVKSKPGLYDSAHSLVTHANPGVRGRALKFCANIADEEQKKLLTPELEKALKDPHPYVRAVAAQGLAHVQGSKSVATLMPLLADKGSCTYDIDFKALNGTAGSVHHDGSPWSRVDDATLSAITEATNKLQEPAQFKYGKIDYKNSDRDINAEVTRARAWFDKNKAAL